MLFYLRQIIYCYLKYKMLLLAYNKARFQRSIKKIPSSTSSTNNNWYGDYSTITTTNRVTIDRGSFASMHTTAGLFSHGNESYVSVRSDVGSRTSLIIY